MFGRGITVGVGSGVGEFVGEGVGVPVGTGVGETVGVPVGLELGLVVGDGVSPAAQAIELPKTDEKPITKRVEIPSARIVFFELEEFSRLGLTTLISLTFRKSYSFVT